jgi:hypothetical protein
MYFLLHVQSLFFFSHVFESIKKHVQIVSAKQNDSGMPALPRPERVPCY